MSNYRKLRGEGWLNLGWRWPPPSLVPSPPTPLPPRPPPYSSFWYSPFLLLMTIYLSNLPRLLNYSYSYYYYHYLFFLFLRQVIGLYIALGGKKVCWAGKRSWAISPAFTAAFQPKSREVLIRWAGFVAPVVALSRLAPHYPSEYFWFGVVPVLVLLQINPYASIPPFYFHFPPFFQRYSLRKQKSTAHVFFFIFFPSFFVYVRFAPLFIVAWNLPPTLYCLCSPHLRFHYRSQGKKNPSRILYFDPFCNSSSSWVSFIIYFMVVLILLQLTPADSDPFPSAHKPKLISGGFTNSHTMKM